MSVRYICDGCGEEVAKDDHHNVAVTKVAAGQSWSALSDAPRLEGRPSVLADICGECRDKIASWVGIKIKNNRDL